MRTLMQQGFGFSWVLPEGAELIKKSLAPSCLFIDSEQFAQTNAKHRFEKRGIAAFVSVAAPLSVLAHERGWAVAVEAAKSDPAVLGGQRAERVAQAVANACDQGADAIVICDELFMPGAQIDPFFALEHLMPCYQELVQVATTAGIPAVFHTQGDARGLYPALAGVGFAGVHVAHPQPDRVRELFSAARESKLVPVGGIVGEGIMERPLDEAVALAVELAQGGPAIICDDGTLEGEDQMARAAQVLTEARRRCHG